MIVMILIGASIFGYFFTLTHVTQDLVAWVGALPTSRWVIIVLILCGYIVLGSFMDQLAILVLTVPIVIPLIKTLGFDPIWFGVIKVVTAEVGMITPPVGSIALSSPDTPTGRLRECFTARSRILSRI